MKKIILFANTDWYLYNFRRSFILALKEKGYDVLLLSPPGDYGPQMLEWGVRWQPLPMDRRSLNPLKELWLLIHLVRLFSQERADLVHGFTIKCAVYGSLGARLAGVRARVNAVAGMGYVFTSRSLKAKWLRPCVRFLLKLALGGKRARLILQNPDDVRLFEEARLIYPKQIRLIPGSGVDLTRFLPRDKPAISEPLRVLLAGRLLWDKGLAEYVDAARSLHAEGRKIRFFLAGTPDSGNPASVPEITVREWEAEGLVEWLGHVSDMPALLASADIVVLPSYREGLPKTLIEAAACAAPLITTDVPGCREVVTHEVEGLLIPSRDAQALALAIVRLQDDPALMHRLGQAARQKALSEFDEKIVVEKTLAVYQEIL